MLREIKTVWQHPGEPFRRWFIDPVFDLTVWFSSMDGSDIIGFQLLYPDGHERNALTWRQGSGYSHHRVDEGETGGHGFKAAPVLMADGLFHKDEVIGMFSEACGDMVKAISEFVLSKLREAD